MNNQTRFKQDSNKTRFCRLKNILFDVKQDSNNPHNNLYIGGNLNPLYSYGYFCLIDYTIYSKQTNKILSSITNFLLKLVSNKISNKGDFL